MKISGFSFLKNGVMLGYPFVQSIQSILPLVDEFVIAVGESDDNTLDVLRSIDSDKIKVVETKWNDKMRSRGYVYGQQKMIAQFSCTGDWAFYLEADEIVHENDLETIRNLCERYLNDDEVEAIAFDYYHFYGNQNTVINSAHWYRSEARIIKNSIRSYAPDGLYWIVLDGRKSRRYPRAIKPGIPMYHYGWVRTVDQLREKDKHVGQYWGRSSVPDISYDDVDPLILRRFTGSHPKIVHGCFEECDGMFQPKNGGKKMSFKHNLKGKLERLLNRDLSKRHYQLVKK